MWRMLEEEPCLPGRTHRGAVSEEMSVCCHSMQEGQGRGTFYTACFIFWPCLVACRVLVSQLGVEHAPPAV